MSLFSDIWNRIKEVLANMISPKTVETVLHITPAISNEMSNAIELWGDMYEGNAYWLHEPNNEDPTAVRSLGLPQFIASEKARMALLEFESDVTTPTEEVEVDNPDYVAPGEVDDFGVPQMVTRPKTVIQQKPTSSTDRAEYLDKYYKKLKKQLRRQIEYGIAKGGLIIKPYVVQNDTIEEGSSKVVKKPSIEFDFVQADGFFPLAFDGSGRITEAAFVQRKVDKDHIYSRLEHHQYKNGVVTVTNKAYKSSTGNDNMSGTEGDLGTPIKLSEVPEWADLEPRTQIKNVDRIMCAYFRMPEANTIDTYSVLGVSGYARAVDLIEQADRQYSRLLWEFEGGELAIDIDRDAMNFLDPDNKGQGKSYMGHLQQRLYRQIDLGESNTYEPYSPTLRDVSLINGLNNLLMRIEDVTGLSRGTIADVGAEARTATELKILKQRSYQTNLDIQHAIQDCLDDTLYIMNAYCDLYKITPHGDYDVSYEWDDSILVDVAEELNKRITLQHERITSRLENRMWYFGETEEQAKQALEKVDQEYQEQAEQSMENEMRMASMGADMPQVQE